MDELTPQEIRALIDSGDIQKYLNKLTPNETAIYQKMVGPLSGKEKLQNDAITTLTNPVIQSQAMIGLSSLGAAAIPAAEVALASLPAMPPIAQKIGQFVENHPWKSALAAELLHLGGKQVGAGSITGPIASVAGMRAAMRGALTSPAAAEEEAASSLSLPKPGTNPGTPPGPNVSRGRTMDPLQAAPGGTTFENVISGGVRGQGIFPRTRSPLPPGAPQEAEKAIFGPAASEALTFGARPPAYPPNVSTQESESDLFDRILGQSRVGGSNYPLQFHGPDGPALRSSVEKAKRAKRRSPASDQD